MRNGEDTSNGTRQQARDLLQEARQLMLKNVEREAAAMEMSMDPAVDFGKYEQAKALFQQVLELDPGNRDALQGIDDCDTMLEPYHPVQYMAPVMDVHVKIPLDDIAFPSGAAGPGEEGVKRLPWEILRSRRGRDKAGIAHTQQAFNDAGRKASKDVDGMLEKARARVDGGESKEVVLSDVKQELADFQADLDRSWKGHGPDILTGGMQALKRILGNGRIKK